MPADYRSIDDPYCYAGTAVLKNIPGLRTAATLAEFEAISVAQRSSEPLPRGRFSVTHYRAVHRHLFGDVYRWAGTYRRTRISKGHSMFCYPENIDREMRHLFGWLGTKRCLRDLTLDEFLVGSAFFLAELNAIHPFREGNGRTQLVFATLLSVQAGHPFHLWRLRPRKFLAAMIESFRGDQAALQTELRRLV
ncbi:MAG: Fic/DOC family protein [Reyranellaceae bacterium]